MIIKHLEINLLFNHICTPIILKRKQYSSITKRNIFTVHIINEKYLLLLNSPCGESVSHNPI